MSAEDDVLKGRIQSGRLPFAAERILARHRRFNEVVVFIHHYGGSKRTVLRHVRLVNELGYDAVRFELLYNKTKPSQVLPITGDFKFGIRHIWANQTEAILNALPEKKILYSFSMPGASALECIARRGASDVRGWICDGGPFVNLVESTWKLYSSPEFFVENRFKRLAYTGFSLTLWGLNFKKEISVYFDQLPAGFKVLSIRGGRDPLVAPKDIDAFFNLQTLVDLEKLEFPEGKHLDGLRAFSAEYAPRIEKFLSAIATPLPITGEDTQQ